MGSEGNVSASEVSAALKNLEAIIFVSFSFLFLFLPFLFFFGGGSPKIINYLLLAGSHYWPVEPTEGG